jgi:hypothetical protein
MMASYGFVMVEEVAGMGTVELYGIDGSFGSSSSTTPNARFIRSLSRILFFLAACWFPRDEVIIDCLDVWLVSGSS